MMAKCWALTKNFKRCRNKRSWGLWCHTHKWQPFKILFVLIFTVWGGAASIYQCVDDKSGSTNQATNLNVDLKPFNKDDYGILVGPFAGGSEEMREKGRDFQHTVSATLRAKFKELNLKEAKVVELSTQKYPSFERHDNARAIGADLDAELVIWGDVTLKGVIPSITVVKGRSYSSQIAKCCGEITIFKNMFSHHFMDSVVDLKLPMITQDPVTITLYAVGLRYFDKGDYKKSLYFLKESLPMNPLTGVERSEYLDISQILTAIGLNYFKLGELENAKNSFARAFDMAPFNAVAGLLLSTCYHILGQDEKSVQTFYQVQVLKAISENPTLFGCIEFFRLRDYDEVINRINSMMAHGMTEDAGLAHLLRGIAFYGKKRYHEAIDDLGITITSFPKFPQPYWYRALSYYSIQKYQEAISDLSTHISLKSHPNSEAYRYRGYAYKHIGHNDNALSDLNKALEIDPSNFPALLFKGVILGQTNQEQEAIKTFEVAAQIKPGHAFINLTLGGLYEMNGEIEKAIESYKKIRAVDPDGLVNEEYIEFAKGRVKYLSEKKLTTPP